MVDPNVVWTNDLKSFSPMMMHASHDSLHEVYSTEHCWPISHLTKLYGMNVVLLDEVTQNDHHEGNKIEFHEVSLLID